MRYGNINEYVLKIMSGDVMNPILRITVMIFVKVLPRYFCDGLEPTNTV